MSTTAFNALCEYIESTDETPEPLRRALDHAAEFNLEVPDPSVGGILSTLAASSTGHRGQEDKAQVVAITPAISVVGLYLLRGLAPNGILTCIEPEAEHQSHARGVFQAAGYAISKIRFLPSYPLDVIGRLANESYQVIYADVDAVDMPALVEAARRLLTTRGTLVLAHSLLDGTLADESRSDRATTVARSLDESLREDDSLTVTRLPLGSGVTLITKH